jgi:hypothetical protein
MVFCKPLIVRPRKTYDIDLALTGTTDDKVAVDSQATGDTERPGSTMCFSLKCSGDARSSATKEKLS